MRRNQVTTSQPEKQGRQVSRGMKLLAGAALLAAGCSTGSGQDSAPKPKAPVAVEITVQSTPDTSPTPVQGDGNTSNDMKAAEDAAWAQLNSDDSEAASDFLSTIDSPDVLAIANNAVDAAEAEDAAWAQLSRDDSEAANAALGLVTSQDLHTSGSNAVSLAWHEDDLWNNGNPANTSEWHDAKTDATDAWHDAKTTATSEWHDAKTDATHSWYGIHQQNSPDA